MQGDRWRERLLASTRGKVLALLRWGPRTVNELAASLALTDNAVRLHLSGLERDGLVEQEGVRRGVGKPAHVYRLSADAEGLFPKSYATLLSALLVLLREREGDEGVEQLLRAVGARLGADAETEGSTLRERVDAAVAVLGQLGGLATVDEAGGEVLIRGYSCPFSAVVQSHPETCALAEQLLSAIVGAQVVECCDRAGVPHCAFRVAARA